MKTIQEKRERTNRLIDANRFIQTQRQYNTIQQNTIQDKTVEDFLIHDDTPMPNSRETRETRDVPPRPKPLMSKKTPHAGLEPATLSLEG